MGNNILWHTLSAEEVQRHWETSAQGLTAKEAISRLAKFGKNKLPESKPESLLAIFFRQFKSPLIYLLMMAAVIVFLLSERIDAAIILFVLLFNAVAGTIQTGKAQNTLMALRKFTATAATVVREGKETIISDEELVPGDAIILQEGEKVPADARVIFSHNLRTDEAALTGESVPVGKIAEVVKNEKAQVAEQKSMVFRGTYIVAGNGKAIVVATGFDTYIGKISKEIGLIETNSPLQANITFLSKLIIITVVTISAAIFALGWLTGKDLTEMFRLSVAVVVSAIPEGLPIVMTLVLATGVRRMSKRNVLVKRLQAVEALGEARVIAVDKTGTITKGELVVQKIYAEDNMFDVTGIGYEPEGEVLLNGRPHDIVSESMLAAASRVSLFCSNAHVSFVEESKVWKVAGDPTEAALLILADKMGFGKEEIYEEMPQLAELPFDPKLKYHAALHQAGEKKILAMAGAPELVLELCSLKVQEKEKLERIFGEMSAEGLRVLALAQKEGFKDEFAPEKFRELTFVALVGMRDALRPEVHGAMAAAQGAGMRVVMITGDYKITAQAIAKEAGIFKEGDEILTGQEIDEVLDEQLAQKLDTVTVFARVTPEHKLRIVKAYRLKGQVISMTGDGVNDALSLVAADLGVAMGVQGTEVAKEAADLVLLDDNFGSIVSAVEEGRNIYKNIRKVILYLFSTSLGEILTIIIALFLGFPLPILAAQLIWLNLVTDGFLDVALVMEPKEKGLLNGRFKRPKKWIVDGYMAQRMVLMGITMAIGSIFLFQMFLPEDLSDKAQLVKAMSIALTVMAVYQWFNAWNCRSETESVFRMNPLKNKYLVGATIIILFLQLAALHVPFMQYILRVSPLSFAEWLLMLAVASSIVVVDEIYKFIRRRFELR
ncbi:MAG: HAD-IC family P-type ATPase [Candidatus Wildermuthbacteria bacterium]|nr:HAD-IC family P-type ATPase [Candidatus Wildermuthbacteria bacterium]